MVATLGRLGIDSSKQVVAYDQDTSMYAVRLWWMLRYLGHDAAAVLDGGFAKWAREGRPSRPGCETREALVFVGQPRAEMLVNADEVRGSLGDERVRLIDSRAPERYRGDVEPLDPVAGHVPGAVNYHYQGNLAPDGTFLTSDELRSRLEAVLGGAPVGSACVYCGSGVTACHNLLALEVAGLGTARLYAGSWSEWCADPSRPVVRTRQA
jgi:thiosulfate/3-mercaptopyruvate sulfurtransferase